MLLSVCSAPCPSFQMHSILNTKQWEEPVRSSQMRRTLQPRCWLSFCKKHGFCILFPAYQKWNWSVKGKAQVEPGKTGALQPRLLIKILAQGSISTEKSACISPGIVVEKFRKPQIIFDPESLNQTKSFRSFSIIPLSNSGSCWNIFVLFCVVLNAVWFLAVWDLDGGDSCVKNVLNCFGVYK